MQMRLKTLLGSRHAPRFWWKVALGALALVTCSALIGYAAAPPAGTAIGNQATATYNDGSGTTHTVTSNLVQTFVQQVASLTLTANGAKTAAPGTQVFYSHVLTNTGNGNDTFTLILTQSAGDNFDLSGLALYADGNQDGIPDNATNLAGSPISLASGAAFTFVIVGTVPGVGVIAGNTSQVTVTATSGFTPAVTAANTDITTVTGNAVINVTKAISTSTGASPSGPYTYTLTYTNTGNATATTVTLTDVIPTGMTYEANSGRWSVTGSTVLTDTADGAQGTTPNITYDFGATVAGRVTAVISQVVPGESRIVTFQIRVNSSLSPQVINNTAQYSYNDGAANVGPFPTNTVPFTVLATAAVVIDDIGSTTDDDGAANDIVTENSAPQGGVVAFANVVHNNGNGTDTFNITFSNTSFPAGTTFQLFKSDSVSPLLDTNSDSIPDTGPLAAGATFIVILKATLPPTATGGPFNAIKTATSTVSPAVSDTVTDRLLAVTPSGVDVTNNTALPGAPGAGAGPEVAAVVTNTASAGTTTTFTLFINNTGPTADTYNLASSTDQTFATITLPAAWVVRFYLDDGNGTRSAGDTLITNTGNVPAGSAVRVFADVSIPAGFAAGTTNLYFRAQSPASGTSDIKHDAVTVATQRSLTLVPNNTGQVFPGGTVVYQHTLTNTGTVTEGGGSSTITLSIADSAAGFTAVLYLDNGTTPGVVDASDTILDDSLAAGGGTLAVALASGASVQLLVKVTAPPGATLGTTDTATLTASVTGVINGTAAPANATATDVTTVISGDLTLSKTQALDAACDGTADTAFGIGNISAAPGQCVCYSITAQNSGTANATAVVINDTTPTFTTVSRVAAVTVGTIAGTSPGLGATGLIQANVGVLTPAQQALLTFCVKIDQ